MYSLRCIDFLVYLLHSFYKNDFIWTHEPHFGSRLRAIKNDMAQIWDKKWKKQNKMEMFATEWKDEKKKIYSFYYLLFCCFFFVMILKLDILRASMLRVLNKT